MCECCPYYVSVTHFELEALREDGVLEGAVVLLVGIEHLQRTTLRADHLAAQLAHLVAGPRQVAHYLLLPPLC